MDKGWVGDGQCNVIEIKPEARNSELICKEEETDEFAK